MPVLRDAPVLQVVRSAALASVLILGASRAGADIVMNPYLQAVGPNEITIMVECSSTANASVDYGTTASYGSSATTTGTVATSANNPATWVHRVKLTGLSVNTVYHYRAQHGASTTGDFTFRTAVAAGTNFRFAFLADFRTQPTIHDAIATRVLNTDNPVVAFYGGDTCNDQNYSTFKSEFFLASELALAAKVPFFNAPGNHEGWSTNIQAFTQAPASGTNGYFSVDYGDVHTLVINNQVAYDTASAQYAFAQSDLAATTKPWKVVVAHYPAYCAGGHNEDAGMKTMTTNLFEPNNVDLVLTGHSHFYQHNLVNGIPHLVVGSVGAPLATPGTASYTVKSLGDYCYAIIDVTPTTLDVTIYNNNGTVLDTLHLSKTIPAPTQLAAAAVSPSQINLTWKDNASNETRYRIERATGAGAFAFVANAAANATSYSNTGLTANTLYRYRVRAENDTDTSAYSADASATTLDDGGGGTIDVRVATSSDDAEEAAAGGTTNLTSTDLELTVDSSAQIIGMRFPNVTIPRGSTITQAYIQFKVDEAVNTNPVSLTVAGQAADNAAAFTATNNNIANRTRTTATVAWTPPDWTVTGEAGTNQRTPELKTVVQEIVNRSGWSRGNALAAVITGSGKRVAEAYDKGSGGGPLLHVVYSGLPPSAPSSLAATAVSESRIDLAWTDNATNETGFKIERKTGSGGTYAPLITVGTNVTACSDTGLAAGTTYYYRVRTTNVTGDSSWCTEAGATTWSRRVTTLSGGYNLIALPVAPAVPFTAESLAQHVAANSSPAVTVSSIIRYDNSLSTFQTHPVGTSTENFSIVAGEGYFLRVNLASGTTTWTLCGRSLGVAPASIPLLAGYNLVGIPREASSYTAESAAAEINAAANGSATQLVRYLAGLQQFDSHPVGTSVNNFPMIPGEGYFIRCTLPSTWTLTKP